MDFSDSFEDSSKSASSGDEVGSTKVTVSLLQLQNRTGYKLVQINGQRKYGGPPPNWVGPPPSKGSEIFVGKIPRDCFEDELVPVFEMVGEIYELRLMMDFSGSNRGFGFVMYMSPEIADLAVQRLNNYEIREGRKIGVVKSVNNCRLFIGGLPADKSEEDIKSVLCRLTEGVSEIKVGRSVSSCPGKSRSTMQHAIVEYDSHRSAAMARRRLIPERVQLWGREIIVDWATPHSRNLCGSQDSGSEIAQEQTATRSSVLNSKVRSSSIGQASDSAVGSLSSRSSSVRSLEQAMDNVLFTSAGNMSSLTEAERYVLASAILKFHGNNSSVPQSRNALSEIPLMREGGNGKNLEANGFDNRMTYAANGNRNKENFPKYVMDAAFVGGENLGPSFGFQTRESGIDQLYLNGATRSQIMMSEFIDSNQNERSVLSSMQLSRPQTFGNADNLKQNCTIGDNYYQPIHVEIPEIKYRPEETLPSWMGGPLRVAENGNYLWKDGNRNIYGEQLTMTGGNAPDLFSVKQNNFAKQNMSPILGRGFRDVVPPAPPSYMSNVRYADNIKENSISYWNTNIVPKSVNNSMDGGMENGSLSFNRAPGEPIYNSTLSALSNPCVYKRMM